MSKAIVSYDVLSLIDRWMEQDQNGVQFPVNFDIAWQIAGYSTKQKAQNKLKYLKEEEDFLTENGLSCGGRPPLKINLSISGFIKFLIASRTQEAKNLVLSFFSALLPLKMGEFDCGLSSSGFVYLVKQSTNNFYKIGKSKNPYTRLQSLQTGSPLEIVIIEHYFSIDCAKLEALLHDHYSAYWVRGEWFDFPKNIIKEFLDVARKLDDSIEVNLLAQV